MSLIVEDVSKSFITKRQQIHTLEKVDIQFKKGEFVCILGPSGCGKSTFLNIIAGLEAPSTGRMVLKGQEIKDAGPGLYAAGDVAGGSPQKYVTGCFAEGEIAALSLLAYIKDKSNRLPATGEIEEKLNVINSFLQGDPGLYTVEDLEEAMQKTMDDYAGRISSGYTFNLQKLQVAKLRIEELLALSNKVKAKDGHELMLIHEVIDRLYVCKVLIYHLEARKETRWHAFQENADYPEKDPPY